MKVSLNATLLCLSLRALQVPTQGRCNATRPIPLSLSAFCPLLPVVPIIDQLNVALSHQLRSGSNAKDGALLYLLHRQAFILTTPVLFAALLKTVVCHGYHTCFALMRATISSMNCSRSMYRSAASRPASDAFAATAASITACSVFQASLWKKYQYLLSRLPSMASFTASPTIFTISLRVGRSWTGARTTAVFGVNRKYPSML